MDLTFISWKIMRIVRIPHIQQHRNDVEMGIEDFLDLLMRLLNYSHLIEPWSSSYQRHQKRICLIYFPFLFQHLNLRLMNIQNKAQDF